MLLDTPLLRHIHFFFFFLHVCYYLNPLLFKALNLGLHFILYLLLFVGCISIRSWPWSQCDFSSHYETLKSAQQ